jgi:signal transduction histidine kinase
MEERAALLGGTVSVQSRPGYGTEIEALIPYYHAEEAVRHRMSEVKDDHSSIIGG